MCVPSNLGGIKFNNIALVAPVKNLIQHAKLAQLCRKINKKLMRNNISVVHISMKTSSFISFLTFMNHVEFIKSIIFPTSYFTASSDRLLLSYARLAIGEV